MPGGAICLALAAKRGAQAPEIVEHQLAAEEARESKTGGGFLAWRERALEEHFVAELDRAVIGDGADVAVGEPLETVGLEQPNRFTKGRREGTARVEMQLCH